MKSFLGLNFTNVYLERESVSGQLFGFELENCTGHFTGGQFHGASGSPTTALKFTGTSRFKVDSCDFGTNWSSYRITAGNTSRIPFLNVAPGLSMIATESLTIAVVT